MGVSPDSGDHREWPASSCALLVVGSVLKPLPGSTRLLSLKKDVPCEVSCVFLRRAQMSLGHPVAV